MYDCPECGKEMIWQNDTDIDEFIVHEYHCPDCLIDLSKQVAID